MKSSDNLDEYEGQLIPQLVVFHNHAMNWLGKASRTTELISQILMSMQLLNSSPATTKP